jgi:hypothetical protein
MSLYALRAETATQKLGAPVWYRFWTQIGPCCTSKEDKRALFHTKEDAMSSQAFVFPLEFFEPVELPDGASGDLNWNKTS